jgi:hypothetical protein
MLHVHISLSTTSAVCVYDWQFYGYFLFFSSPYAVVFLFLAQQPPGGQALLIHEVSRSHTMTHQSR